jgi:nucleotide-binding universal stress UspA family protein
VENILVAVDMTDEAQQAIDRAIAVRDRYEADISALTVVSRTAAPSQAWMQRPQLERFLR